MPTDQKLRLIKTCHACPEQYDVYLGGEEIGYMRLRHGRFRAEYRGCVVYAADTSGDGRFIDSERHRHLNRACAAILNAHAEASDPAALYEMCVPVPEKETP